MLAPNWSLAKATTRWTLLFPSPGLRFRGLVLPGKADSPGISRKAPLADFAEEPNDKVTEAFSFVRDR